MICLIYDISVNELGEVKEMSESLFSIKTEQIKSLRDVVLESLREAIVTGRFKPGEHLKERELAEIMGVSTTPIKEAFRMLGYEGLVETIPRKGTFVSELAETSIQEVQMLRASIEGLCAKLAAVKLTEEQAEQLSEQINYMEQLLSENKAEQLVEENTKFHQLIREAASNPMISQILENISSFDQAFRKRALMEKNELYDGFNEHKQIYEAIISKNPDQAEAVTKQHILRTAHDVLNVKMK
ncbi:GntR family transcriptional regulator [Bacillus sp. FJAT-50079]|uniref:GntR family transcriptional regulator n=1 Tax=Bacillus sp. FJAT-50079 TaxID=2833577 RepID=UPI001BCA0E7A|nr:GntR family transcriptional regulator [Bacillus sp. FJAT-50079]MBS4209370.1 GntR family transcriptional regulator [Bacillus sp. FJAT-50079]